MEKIRVNGKPEPKCEWPDNLWRFWTTERIRNWEKLTGEVVILMPPQSDGE